MLVSNKYLELLQSFPPRPITSEADFLETQEVINSLLDKSELTQEEEDYLDVLGTLVYDYQQKQEPIPDIYGVELIKAFLVEFDLRQKDLVPIFKTESIASDVLNGKRNLTVEHIEALAQFFHVSPAVFFPEERP